MKRLIPVFLSVIVGCGSAYVIYKNVETNYIKSIEGNAVAIQIGAFTKLENAEKMRDNYGGIVYKDNGVYRVYYSVLKNNENIDFITSYLKLNGINYYIKSIRLDDKYLDKLDKYEELMEKTNNTSKIRVNNEILKSIKGEFTT